MVKQTQYEQIPNYLKPATVLEPEGDIPAGVAAELESWTVGAAEQRLRVTAHPIREGVFSHGLANQI